MRFDINPGNKEISGLTLPEIFARERFVSLYLKNSKKGFETCLAMGYEPLVANQVWIYYKNDVYVQNKILEAERELENCNGESIKRALMAEAQCRDQRASHAARVAALVALARIEGLDKTSAPMDVPAEEMALADLAKAVKAQLETSPEALGAEYDNAPRG